MTGPHRRCAAALLLVVAAALGSGGCSGDDRPHRRPPDPVAAVAHVLDARARAVRSGDEEAFDRTLGHGAALRTAQHTWFADLAQLPVQRLAYRVDPATLEHHGSSWSVTARASLQLRGYDAAPVVSPVRVAFRPVRPGSGRVRLTAVDPQQPQPWDLGAVEVRERPGVLGVFDAGSVADAPTLLDSVERGVAPVADQVPYGWPHAVVVYALSDAAYLDGLPGLPGEDPDRLDAVAFPVGRSTRVVLNPRMLDRSGAELDRLVRHEVTHVAVGTHDDHAPVWLSEGLAEWVAVQPLPPEERRVPEAALAAARAGTATLPDDGSFNGHDAAAHYGLAWWAVQHLADTYGADEPWRLLDAFARPGTRPDRVLLGRYGTTTQELAQQAARLIVSLYGQPAG